MFQFSSQPSDSDAAVNDDNNNDNQLMEATCAVVPAPLDCKRKGKRLAGGAGASGFGGWGRVREWRGVGGGLPSYHSEKPLAHKRQMCLFSKQGRCGGRDEVRQH